MTFLNAILLGGLGAASIPLIIHLLHRRRLRIVKWGAMHLLEDVLKKHQRRFRLEELLLLLLRCAIPAVLAFCLARPVLTGAGGMFGAAKSSLAVLLDNSYSMDARPGAAPNFDFAREAATKKISALARGSDAAVHLMAGGTVGGLTTGTTDLDWLKERVGETTAGFGKASIPDSLDAAAGRLANMKNGFREVVLISDFQRINWTAPEAAARARAVEALQKSPLPPQLTLYRVGTEERENVAVESLQVSRPLAGVGQPLQVRANLKNFGERQWENLRVYFRVDGHERSAVQITLAPHEQRQLLFTHTFDKAGSHVLEVSADADALKADNSAAYSIPVVDRIPVLLINGEPSPEPLRGETDFLEIALQPFGAGKVDMADLITTRVVDVKEFKSGDLANVRVCVLANVAQLYDWQENSLLAFARDGGGVLFFPGSRWNTNWYNGALHKAGLLPLPVRSLGGSASNDAPAAHIVAQSFSHPALELFNDPRNGKLSDADIHFWFKFGEAVNTNDPVGVAAQLDNGDPFLVERKYGRGLAMACATACDADWSNLPTRPFYVPLMQSLVAHLASTVYPSRNLEVGKPILAFTPRSDSDKTAKLTTPAGKLIELTVTKRGDRGAVEFADTAQPGIYTLTTPDGTITHYVASPPRDESDLALLTDDEFKSVAKEMGAAAVSSWEQYKQLDQTRRFGRELWKPLLWSLLALLLGELVLQQWFGRRRG
ncbi:MAG: BatA domain-containing protein [Verrucomicrobia bacterium]|nr:BatA domain-containing protein [Verrucomicrobiota bacterium]